MTARPSTTSTAEVGVVGLAVICSILARTVARYGHAVAPLQPYAGVDRRVGRGRWPVDRPGMFHTKWSEDRRGIEL